jgi:hypothetical protein
MNRHTLVLRVLALPAVALAATLPLGAQTSEPIDVDVALSLGISRGYQEELNVPDTIGRPFAIEIVIGEEHYLVDLVPDSVRSDDFRLLEQRADGRLVEVDPGPVNTVQGTLVEDEGSSVSGSLDEQGLVLRILTSSGQEYWLQPLWNVVDHAGPRDYVIYRDDDIFESEGSCAADTLPENQAYVAEPSWNHDTLASGGVKVAELGCDADFQYFQKYGSTTAVSNRIQSVIGTMNQQYESEVGITHDITTIIVRTTSNQPYTSTNPDTLLNQFRTEWVNNQTGVLRDTAHLFTGKNLDGSTIGIAWLAVICNHSFGYGLVQSDFNNNFASATDLSAHELGHNWSAPHCDCPATTMNPYITSANTFHVTLSRPPIIQHRDSRNCLDNGGPVTLFTDGFESGSFVAGGWVKSSANAAVVTGAARTGVYGARIKAANNISKAYSTVGYTSVQLKYSRRTTGMDAGEKLFVEYWNGTSWVLVESTAATGWAEKTFTLGAGSANKAGFKFRFRTNADLTTERADIDNVELIGTP